MCSSDLLQGLKRRGVSGSGIYRGFLVGYAVWLFSDSTFVTVAINLGRPTPTPPLPPASPWRVPLCPCHRRLLALAMPFPSVFHRPTDNVYISGNPIYFMYPNKSYFYRLSRACYVAPIGLSHSSRNWHAIGGAKIITKYFISGEIK